MCTYRCELRDHKVFNTISVVAAAADGVGGGFYDRNLCAYFVLSPCAGAQILWKIMCETYTHTHKRIN